MPHKILKLQSSILSTNNNKIELYLKYNQIDFLLNTENNRINLLPSFEIFIGINNKSSLFVIENNSLNNITRNRNLTLINDDNKNIFFINTDNFFYYTTRFILSLGESFNLIAENIITLDVSLDVYAQTYNNYSIQTDNNNILEGIII